MPALSFPDSAAMRLRHSLSALLAVLFATALHADEAKPVDNTPKLAYGLMMKQGDKVLFAPCRDRSYANFDDVSTDQAVSKLLDEMGLSAGKRLYVELLGVLENGTLKASGFNMVRVEGRCQMPGGKEESWRAAGNDPAWALAAGGEHVQLLRYGQPEVALPYAEFKAEGKFRRYDGAKDGNKLAVRLEQSLCRDSEANAVFAWSATVDLNGQVLKGCAWQR
jgi:putative lipoprotein